MATSKPYIEIAHEVLAGEWGNNEARIMSLINAGYNPDTVQNIVNVLCLEQGYQNEHHLPERVKEFELDCTDCDAIKLVVIV